MNYQISRPPEYVWADCPDGAVPDDVKDLLRQGAGTVGTLDETTWYRLRPGEK